jgi:hypothetical protein
MNYFFFCIIFLNQLIGKKFQFVVLKSSCSNPASSNIDFLGNDLSIYNEGSFDSCCKLCFQLEECKAISWDIINRVCILKSTAGTNPMIKPFCKFLIHF